MRTVLLPFYDDEVSRHAFALATQLVRSVDGYVEGLFVLRRPQILGYHRRHELAVETNFFNGDKILIVNDFQMFVGGKVEARI